MREIKLVRQECGSSCGVACVAMVSGKTFGDVRVLVDDPALSPRDLDNLLGRCGVTFERQLYPDLLPHSLYIVSAPSLNIRAGMHWIVLLTGESLGDGRVSVWVFDPAPEGKQSYADGGLSSWAEATRIVDRVAA